MRFRLLLSAALSVLTLAVAAPAFAADNDDAGGGIPLTVATYNIHAGAGMDNVFDIDRTAAAVRSLHADVVALQEVDVHWMDRSQWRDLARDLSRRTGMHVYFGYIYSLDPPSQGAPRREFGNALLSRYPIRHAVNHEITRLSTQDPNPVPALAPGFPEIDIKVRGEWVRVYATHLDYRADPSVREAQVADMLSIMDKHPGTPHILLGDLNASAASPELTPLWSTLTDAWGATGSSDPGYSYPADKPDSRIDVIAPSKGIGVRSAAVVDTLASDHRPVVARLNIPRH
ncbi:MAG TPA: endonuclease/exonuclease/phosphatase family protein [Stackebrandtia sp.]|jgi:endonuclease/exonuclease/phosphatase family metal-dependent hydrolase|uniref:endonuclease/exonuclease/phosphatase family protein n=1 Tax=Stackebrandtia sp. TaxID=2023065 RepID=UPI002D477056|nr:endonuclease/exonuclease/phosphatase family protein [Stackebrandtia sp.]HZE38102.1 endonuclease/exonuclease/phosphatase family protein [Stackebrandtia sp.]